MVASKLWWGCIALGLGLAGQVLAADSTNEPTSGPGIVPVGEDGKPLNLNFESGDLKDWTATGQAFEQQPIKGGIGPDRPLGTGKKSLHTGEFWMGGFEKLFDEPQGTLQSVAFKVTQPWASMLVGGGSHQETRVELLDEAGKVFFVISGPNTEELSPVVVDLRKQKDKAISIRITDMHSGGWGHVNFDDFRFHEKRPSFTRAELGVKATSLAEVYPHAGLTAEEAAAAMQVPPGFKVQVAASEPNVTQPIAMCWDDRGRLWVAEAHSYPQRNPEGEGADRIVIFEDTDENGTLDKKTTFIEGLNLVSGLAVGFDGVWVGAAPYLMFIPDTNGDDVPDGLPMRADPPQPLLQFPKDVPPGAKVLLDGWHWEDTHETLNAFIWGPDGWLYGCHGVFTHSLVGKPGTPKAERMPINAGIWRYHPVRHEFEVFAHGSSNPWGVDFNEYGEAFCTACVIPHLYHIIPGGRFERQAGAHFNPHTYNDIKTIARHRHFTGGQWNNDDRKASDDLGGGHAHAGAMIYQGGAWPEEYNGKLFMHNIHGNRINIDQLIPEGSGYAGDRYPDFLLTGDKWSQMINLMTGPDGQVWMIDWYDANQCHRPEEGLHDTTNGRIFRVSYGDVANPKIDLRKLSDQELVGLSVNAPNEWHSRHARRLLQERVAAGKISQSTGIGLLFSDPGHPEIGETDIKQQMRFLWTMHIVVGPDHLQEMIKDVPLAEFMKMDPHVLAFGMRMFSEHQKLRPETYVRRVEMAKVHSSPIVRLALASTLNRTPLADRWAILEGLITHAEDAKDHNLPLMYWYAMEPLADVDPARALALAVSAGETIPVLREYMIRRLGSGDPAKMLDLLVDALDKSKPEDAPLYLRGILLATRGLKEHARYAQLQELPKKYTVATSQPEVVFLATAIAHRAGADFALANLRDYARISSWPVEVRRDALKYVIDAKSEGLAELLPQLVDDPAMRGDALRSLAAIDHPAALQPVIDKFGTFTPAERRDAMSTLTARPSYARELLAAVQANRIPKTELSADLVRQLRNLNDADLNTQIEQVWGIVRESAADRVALMARLKTVIGDKHGATPDREVGRAIFAKTCQQCHTLFGTGGKIGPDITGANRANLDYLLSNIVDPSSVMAKEYQPAVISTKDGRVVTGIIKQASGPGLVAIQTPEQLIEMPESDIDERQLSDKSMMPDDLLRTLSDSEVRSLVAYLQGMGQSPIRANRDNIATFFNGQDLTGWIGKTEAGGLWTVEPGATPQESQIIGQTTGLGHNEFLVSQFSLTDFRFKCQVLLKDNQGNSGIQLRSAPQPNGEVKGYQADIGPGWWGKVYEELGRGLIENNNAEQYAKPNEWNTYEIVAVGSRVRTYLNGHLCVDRDDPAGARSGVIALQLHSGGATEVRFKNLELTLLDQLPPHAAAGSQPNQWPVSRGGAFEGTKISFKKTQLDTVFRSEGVGIGDLDNDGDMDIAGGSQWYEQGRDKGQGASDKEEKAEARNPKSEDGAAASGAQPWVARQFVVPPKEFDPKGYSDSFMNYPDDLNGDGRLDLVVVDFPGKQTWWFENPGGESDKGQVASAKAGAAWPRHEMIPVTNNESPQYLDVNGDGVRELVAGFENGLMGISTRQSLATAPWKMLAIGAPGTVDIQRFYHGLGIGDIDQDGRNDILVPNGWWKAPEQMTTAPWTFNEAKLGGGCSQMYVYDFDGDGDNDVLSASPHDYGIWWHEQEGKPSDKAGEAASSQRLPTFKTHEIEKTFSETHAVVLADINGDGLPDFVTGKRWWSHGGHGPGGGEAAVLYWFELKRENGTATWVRHTIDEDSGVGTAFEVADINGDGLLDFAISNKKGTFVFEQERK
ncbi:MAG: DUF1080 domain-containing protein [Planctomycetota bacterium]|nr:MAG: DUF1080 domain-containing protein [Planctomycetota bacterium]